MHDWNQLGEPIGFALDGWTPPSWPPRDPMEGHFCRVEALDRDQHTADLFDANAQDIEHRIWTYLPYGPFDNLADYTTWMRETCLASDPMFHAIIDIKTAKAVGVASYLRIDPANGSIEVGHINFSPRLQRTPAATEAMYLMMKRAFELGYRRYEWKCDALNASSRAAAQRLGLSFEGAGMEVRSIQEITEKTEPDKEGTDNANYMGKDHFSSHGNPNRILVPLTSRLMDSLQDGPCLCDQLSLVGIRSAVQPGDFVH